MSFSIGMGYLAILALLGVFLLTFRWRWLELCLGGFDRALFWHHLVLGVFFLASNVHVMQELPSYFGLTANQESIGSILERVDKVFISGFLSIGIFYFVSGLALHKYIIRMNWLWIHRASYLGFLSLLIHLWFVRAEWDLSLDNLRDALWIFSLVAGSVLLFFLFVHSFFPSIIYRNRIFKIIDRMKLGSDLSLLTLRLQKPDSLWKSGSFGFFSFKCKKNCGVSQELHIFTVLRLGPDTIQIIVKNVGDDTLCLQNIALGTSGKLYGPHGSLFLSKEHENTHVWIAGGIGILPFFGFISELQDQPIDIADIHLVSLYYRGREPPYLKELRQIGKSHSWFHFWELIDNSEHPMGAEDIDKIIPEWKKAKISLAGPKSMLEHWRKALKHCGVKRSSIRTEDFMR